MREIPNMLSNTHGHVLSDVHTDCQYQEIPTLNRAVTRFKIHFPHFKDSSDKHQHKPEFLQSNACIKTYYEEHSDEKLERQLKAEFGNVQERETERSEHEERLLFDEDGDPVLDRNACTQLDEDGDPVLDRNSCTQLDEDGDLVLDRNACTQLDEDGDPVLYRNSCTQLDEDGDLVLDRNSCTQLDFREEEPSRKKIKFDHDVQNINTKSVEVGEDEREDVLDCCDRLQWPNIRSEEDVKIDNFRSDEPAVEQSTQSSKIKTDEIHQNSVSDGRDMNSTVDRGPSLNMVSSLSSDMPVSGVKKEQNTPNKVKKNLINVGDASQEAIVVATTSNTEKESSDVKTEDDRPNIYYINIKHSLATDLDNVGEQVWHGALLLSDYIISNHWSFEKRTIVDLGAGVGLSSIVAAMYANVVFCTDTGDKILSLAEDNITAATTCPMLPRPLCTVHVKQLDWFKGLEEDGCKHGLTKEDISRIQDCEILLAADVIYDFDITDAFFSVVKQIMVHPPMKTLYIGLEKRIVFTAEDLTITSPGYNYFRLHLDDLCSGEESDTQVSFEVEQIDASFPQFFEYNRIKQLELWKITAVFGS